MPLADRGYDADWIRAFAASTGALANIAPRCNRGEPICFGPCLYRARNLVERFCNKTEHCRRVARRYDKLAADYLAFVQRASIRLWLRVDESAPQQASPRGARSIGQRIAAACCRCAFHRLGKNLQNRLDDAGHARVRVAGSGCAEGIGHD
jgi:transposase